VSDETTFVVWKSILTSFVDLEGVVAPDDELSFFVYFPIQGPEAMCFAEPQRTACASVTVAPVDAVAAGVLPLLVLEGTFLPRTFGE